MSKYNYEDTAKAIEIANDNLNKRIEELGDITKGLQEFGLSDQNVFGGNYNMKATNTTAEAVVQVANDVTDSVFTLGDGGANYLATAFKTGLGRAADLYLVGSVALSENLEIKKTLVQSIASHFGYRLTDSIWNNAKVFWEAFEDALFEGDVRLMLDKKGNALICKRALDYSYVAFSNMGSGEPGTYLDGDGNELPVKFVDSLHYEYEQGQWRYVYDVTCREHAKLMVYCSNADPSYLKYQVLCDTSGVSQADVDYTSYLNDVIQSHSVTQKNSLGNASTHSLVVTLLEHVWYGMNPGNGTTSTDGSGTNMSLITDVSPIPTMLPSEGLPNTLNGVTAVVNPGGLNPISGVPHPITGGGVPSTYPNWELNKISRNINQHNEVVTEDLGDDFYPIVIVDSGTIENLTAQDIDDFHTSPLSLPDVEDKEPYTSPTFWPDFWPSIERDTDPVISNGVNPSTPIPTNNASTPRPSAAEPGAGGDGTGFVSIYHPTKAQLSDFSHWFWNINYTRIDQELAKIFSNPIESVISLHMIFATPSNKDNAEHIILGRLDSEVNSDMVADPTIHLTCGSVFIPEYYNNALDYHNTYIDIYLPFIGIKQLDAVDVIGAHVGVEYLIDVLTGCCVAFVHVIRDGVDAILYQFAGSCSVQVPVTGTSYGSIINGLLGSIAGGAVSMGVGAMVGITNLVGGGTRTGVNGTITGNAGALAPKKPYIICRRPISKVAYDYQNLIGYPSSTRVKLSNCSGLTRVKAIHLDDLDATREEKIALEAILKTGVYI